MPFLNVLILSLFIFNFVDKQLAEVAKTAEIVICPKFCYCDLFDGLNRANCSSKYLSALNTSEIPLEVEILDLSHNYIYSLEKDTFENFVFLKKLILSYNYIGSVHPEAFNPLRSITNIDLSHSGLYSINEKIVKTNRKLQRLNLSGNNFGSLRNKPVLRSPWLRSLKLQNAKITHLYPEFFLALPNLRELDVSSNRMIALNIAAFRGLRRLEHLNLTGNFWGCPPNVLKVVKLLQKRDIKIESKECDKVIHADNWSETQNASTTAQHNASDPSAHQNTWHHLSPLVDDSEDEDQLEPSELELVTNKIVCEFVETEKTADCNTTPEELCYKYRKCLKDRMYGKKVESGNDLYFIFLIGFAFGIIFVICFVACAICLKRWCAARRKRPDTTENHITESEVSHTARPLIQPSASAAPATRRTSALPPATTAPRRQTSNPRGNASMPTSLINLFNNPLNQHLQTADNSEQQQSTNRGPIPTAPSFSSEEEAAQVPAPLSSPHEDHNERSQVTVTTEPPAVESNDVPDYPPPSYGEVMVNSEVHLHGVPWTV